MSNTIQRVECSDDFEADVLLSGEFLQQFNLEMVWASKGFVFIRINPTFHLDEEAKQLMDDDFELFRKRLLMEHHVDITTANDGFARCHVITKFLYCHCL